MGAKLSGLRGSDCDPTYPPELAHLSDKVGDFIQYWGFKRVHGRIWTHLFLSNKPLDAQSLIDRLSVSKALISFSIRDLLEFNVIREAGRSTRNTVLYEANPDITSVIMGVLERREKKLLSSIDHSFKIFAQIPKVDLERFGLASDRVQCFGEMVDLSQVTLDSMIALKDVQFSHWQRYLEQSTVSS